MKLSVVDEVDARTQGRDSLIVFDLFDLGESSQIGRHCFSQKFVNGRASDAPETLGVGPVEQLTAGEGYALFVENLAVARRHSIHQGSRPEKREREVFA